MKKYFFIVAAIITSSPLIAQDTVKAKLLDEVVVTATKYPVKLSETGKVLTVISHEQIERSQGKDLPALLNEQAGILINGARSNPGKDKSVFLRGASNDYALILLDGMPVYDASGIGGAFDLRMLPLNQVERIEILKGSQSTLYGSDAIAGVINIITNKNIKKPLSISAGANYGSLNSTNANAAINGHSRILDYTAAYSYAGTDGISEATDTTAKGNYDKDGYRRHSFQAKLSFQAGKRLKLMPYYRYTKFNGHYDADAFKDGNNTFSSILNNAGAVATFDLPKGTITANYGYTQTKRDYTNYPFKGKFQQAELYLARPLNQELKLLAGINYQQYHLIDSALPVRDPHTSILSPYVSFLVQGGSGLSLDAGARYNYHSKFGSYFTYSFSATHKVGNGIKVFANISSGFKAPTVTQLFGAFGSNPSLKPEKSNSLEAGVDWHTLKNKLAFTLTGFQRDIKDVITYVSNGYINIDQQHDNGFELESNYSPIDKITIKASYTFVTGKVEQNRNGKDSSFFNLVRRPKHKLVFNAGYQISQPLYVSLGLESLSRRTDLYYEPVPPYATLQVYLKAYALLNAYIEYRFLSGKYRLYADAKNITGSKYTEVYGYNTTGFTANFGFNIQL